MYCCVIWVVDMGQMLIALRSNKLIKTRIGIRYHRIWRKKIIFLNIKVFSNLLFLRVVNILISIIKNYNI